MHIAKAQLVITELHYAPVPSRPMPWLSRGLRRLPNNLFVRGRTDDTRPRDFAEAEIRRHAHTGYRVDPPRMVGGSPMKQEFPETRGVGSETLSSAGE